MSTRTRRRPRALTAAARAQHNATRYGPTPLGGPWVEGGHYPPPATHPAGPWWIAYPLAVVLAGAAALGVVAAARHLAWTADADAFDLASMTVFALLGFWGVITLARWVAEVCAEACAAAAARVRAGVARVDDLGAGRAELLILIPVGMIIGGLVLLLVAIFPTFTSDDDVTPRPTTRPTKLVEVDAAPSGLLGGMVAGGFLR